MKVKLNKRLLRLGVACIIAAIILTAYMYSNIKKAAEPEETIKVAHFNNNLIRNTILEDKDIIMIDVPISRTPDGALRNKEAIVGKRLVADVNKGEYAFLNKVTERGEVRLDIEDMWLIGIDIKDISNFLGVQLKAGEYYGLIYPDETGEIKVRQKVKIISLIDNVGREIFSNGEGVPKTINVAVETEEELLSITKAKHLNYGTFEIIKTPIGWEIDTIENLENNEEL
ncbi:hypothetical protein F8154_05735 [Alkaliphilus pronyensis]|uniref:SAF domain-containing protein n=1 Tax=Alkaliphilus pronyensis TaxID=1482732 RepID=A0A6I0FHJ5_9FIRM|nr:SAF domain-containing protein [Alkaliphilus pronyensis]KAB3535631.1 hypothetical protein F8154_05735 [Alkaliphilus pronyensis]